MLPGTKCIVFRKVPAIYFPVELYMQDRRKHASPGEGEIIFNLCEYSQQCTTNTGRDLELDGDVSAPSIVALPSSFGKQQFKRTYPQTMFTD